MNLKSESPAGGEVAAQPSEFQLLLSDFAVACRHWQSEKCRVLMDVLVSMYESVSPPPTAPTTGEAVFRNALELIRDWPLRDSKMESAQMRKLAHDTLNALATPTPASASTWAVREFDIEQIVDVAMFGDRGNRRDLFNRIKEILEGRAV